MTVEGMYHEESIDLAADPATVYAMLTDVSRMGEWSPECVGARWLDGDAAVVGSTFEGDNKIGDREWSVVCTVTEAADGREFGWVTGPADEPYVHWLYRIEATEDGSRLTEIWDVRQLPPTLVDLPADRLAGRAEAVRAGMKQTLAAMKSTIEA